MSQPSTPTKAILLRLEQGDESAPAELYGLVEAELRRLAQAQMRTQAEGHTLQVTALVHEAWMKLTAGEGGTWRDHGHFVATAASAMRQILVDHARAKASLKRGGQRQRESLEEVDPSTDGALEQLIALDEALAAVERQDERARKVAELRLFGGLTPAEIAASLSISPRSVDRAWQIARNVLQDELGEHRVG